MKHMKDTKVGYVVRGEGYQDEWGVSYPGALSQVASLWASFAGADYKAEFAGYAWLDKPLLKATFTRPSDLDVRLYDFIEYQGKLYMIKHVVDLSGKVGRDVKVICEYDDQATAEWTA